MRKEQKGAEITRRSILRKSSVAAGAGIGVAATAGSASANGKKDKKKKNGKKGKKGKGPCPKCSDQPGGPTRYKIAHRPPGNPDNCQTLCLPAPAARAHLEQHDEDTCGPC